MAILTKNSEGGFNPSNTYTVQKGDTLTAIGQKYGVPATSITGYRSGDPNLIYPGEVLNIGKSTQSIIPQPANPGSQTQQTPQQPSADPVTKFNQAILDMLQKAQSGGGNENLFKQQTALQRAQIDRTSQVTPEAQQVLSPQQQESIRSGSAKALSPEIDAISSKIKSNDSRLQNFESILGQMRTIGMDTAKLNPAPEVLQGYRSMLEAGGSPGDVPQEVIGKVSSMVDWNKWSSAVAANKKAGSASGASGLSPNGVDSMVQYFLTTGTIPPMGLGQATRDAFWSGVANSTSQGQNPFGNAISNKATISSVTSSLRNQQTQLAGAKTSIGTLDKQLSLLQDYSSKVDRTGSPLINKYLLYLKGQVAGDPDTQAIQNIVTTASYEFSKILSGSAASIAGTTVSSASDAEHLLNSSLNPDQMTKVISLMRQESNYRLTSQQQTIDSMQSTLNNLNSSSSAGSSPTTIRVKRISDGQTGTIPEGEFNSSLYTKL